MVELYGNDSSSVVRNVLLCEQFCDTMHHHLRDAALQRVNSRRVLKRENENGRKNINQERKQHPKAVEY